MLFFNVGFYFILFFGVLEMVRAGNLLLLGSGQSVKLKTLSNTSINLILILVELFVRWVFFSCVLFGYVFSC